jgi:signal transduction histidine kinase
VIIRDNWAANTGMKTSISCNEINIEAKCFFDASIEETQRLIGMIKSVILEPILIKLTNYNDKIPFDKLNLTRFHAKQFPSIGISQVKTY